MTELKASTIGVFSYVQPVIAILFAIIAGRDSFTPVKMGATILVFTGVFMATKKKSKPIEVS
jgi:drug/metabolite transporter (DMT)-like permease